MTGYIKLHREILNKPIWKLSTPEQKSILITLLLMANHSDNEWEFAGEKYNCKPGQFITSLDGIVKKSGKGVSQQNVRTSLKRFEKLEFLTDESTNHNRLITILNWEVYQDNNNEANNGTNKQLTSDQQATNKRLTTNKNDKNDKNDKNVINNTLLSEIKISDVPDENKQFYTIALTFHDIMQNYLTKLKVKSTAKHTYLNWINNIRLMFENDKRTIAEFREVAEYLKKEIPDGNGFSWQANIRSADALRKQFEKVLIKARQMKLAKKESGTYRKITEPNLMES